MAYDIEATKKKSRSKLSDEDFLAILQSERRQSIGFEHDNVLVVEREVALNYFKGEMADMPHLPGRSGAVSTDVADAIETVLPDLVEIFTGGDDVVTFKAISAKDEAPSKQETEYVKHVVYQENDGFLVLYSMFKDALQSKIGVVKWWWEEKPIKPEFFEGKTNVEVAIMAPDGTISDLEQDGVDDTGEPTWSFTLTNEDPGGEVHIQCLPPEDFTVARDTVRLCDTTYAAFRTRPRAQDLIAQGVPQDMVDTLPPYGYAADETVVLARDTAGEHEDQMNVVGIHDMRTVEVIEHFVRVDADGDGKPELWRCLTAGTETIMIEKEQVDRAPFAAITPYIVTHRFYGESLADRLIQIQRIKTALIRMMLDSGYFALNQRVEVSDKVVNEWTISDLMRLEPGMPIRVKDSGGINPIAAGELNFEVFQALEYVSTMGEQRTGVVRNAQGLNPDTLHDTAGGMEKLMMAAQLRMRLIARIFAETGVKDMFLGVHAMLRKHKHQAEAKIGNKWIPVDCSQWGERSQMAIDVGLGSAGRVQEMAAMQLVVGNQAEIVKAQGGTLDGPLVSAQNVYNAVTRLAEKAGEKAPEMFFTDPSQAGPQPPKPPPGAAEAQQKAQADAASLQQKSQQEAAELAAKTKAEQDRLGFDFAAEHDKDQRERLKLQYDHEREVMKIQNEQAIKEAELEVKRADVLSKLQIEKAQLANALQIAIISAGTTLTMVQVKAMAEAARADVDIEMQARDHAHEADQAQFAADNAPEPAPAASSETDT